MQTNTEADKDAMKHWRTVASTLMCSLCDATTKTQPPNREWNPKPSTSTAPCKYELEYQWIERMNGDRSVVLCPQCTKGKWFTHGPMQWAVNELIVKPTYTGAQLLWYKESTEKVYEKSREVIDQKITTKE
jgi:hypothetical protein